MKNQTILFSAAAAAMLAIAPLASAQVTATTATSTTFTPGTISEFSPDTIVIRSETAPAPIRYSYTKTTTYVDDEGAPVSMDLVKSGLPVKVYYVKEGDRMVANRVVVSRKVSTTTATDAAPAVIERKTTTLSPVPTPAPVIEEKKTTTTTTTTK